jgi:2-oxoglutarate dehydrogenase E1 component
MTAEGKTPTLPDGANRAFVEDLYARFLADPNAVDGSWQGLFAELGDELGAVVAAASGASLPTLTRVSGAMGPSRAAHEAPAGIEGIEAPEALNSVRASLRALMMIRAYRVRGHLIADLDPLGLEARDHHPELDYKTYGFSEADLDRRVFIDGVLGLRRPTLRDIDTVLRCTYCGAIGFEFMHIQGPEEKAWIQARVEGQEYHPRFTDDGRRNLLRRLTRAEGFERFLQRKYVATKRFGLEGAESLVPALEAIIRRGAEHDVREIIIGMPHRGRLNILANVMGKPYTAIFSEFEGKSAHPADVQGSGDVKYHLGTSSARDIDGHPVHLSLTPNPSHLEAVDPVVLGKVRAKQMQLGDTERTKVMAVLMHGDAAFAGQGLIAECFGLSELRGYRTGGTVHIIVNNQIGFTTSPGYARSSPYPSDVAKAVQAPIFHVNGDDPEAVVHAARVATEYRQKFHKDVVIDMFCYRRHGHNESDEPSFTQPLMYRKIAEHPTTRELYAARLAATGVMPDADADDMAAVYRRRLDGEFDAAKHYKPNKADWLDGRWTGFSAASGEARCGKTAVDSRVLKKVGRALCEVPADFNPHRTIRRQLDAKHKAIAAGEGIDWATAEALAFGSLLLEGVPVRLSGQDCGRGTFSHRHSVLVDQDSEARYLPLNNIAEDQATYEVVDSLLSEAAVLGFEYGYTQAEPIALVLWEAQFGDFANGAQVIIDQFLASGESKWLRMSGLVMLLPHGHEGQGPEHSSARLERYLQLSAEDNWQVVNCTSPASYFHVLRRQIHRNFRKPLIVMTPKSLLRHKRAVSRLADMATKQSFHRILWDEGELVDDPGIKRVVLCSGKIYYDIFQARTKRGIDNVVVLRLEQLFPVPAKALEKELRRFKGADVVWCQEEPKNMGAWSFITPHIETALNKIGAKTRRPRYVGRPEMASPSEGTLQSHTTHQSEIVEAAIEL